jgi:hypothetical protein
LEVKEDSEEAEVEATIEEAKVAEENLEDESQIIPLPFISSYMLERRTAGKYKAVILSSLQKS